METRAKRNKRAGESIQSTKDGIKRFFSDRGKAVPSISKIIQGTIEDGSIRRFVSRCKGANERG